MEQKLKLKSCLPIIVRSQSQWKIKTLDLQSSSSMLQIDKTIFSKCFIFADDGIVQIIFSNYIT